MKKTDALNLFWENSKLSPQTIRSFALGLESYAQETHIKNPLIYPGKYIPLFSPRDIFDFFLRKRKSNRLFSKTPLSFYEISSLLSVVKKTNNSYTYPSAGGIYPLDFFVFITKEGIDYKKGIYYYHPEKHALVLISEIPEKFLLREICGDSETFPELPSVFIVITGKPDKTTDKYSDRGGRFVLLEAGHAMQNLLLRATYDKIATTPIGGVFDDYTRDLCLLEPDSIVLHGVAIGVPLKHSIFWRKIRNTLHFLQSLFENLTSAFR